MRIDAGTEAGSDGDEISALPLNLDRALLHRHPGLRGVATYIETRTGDRDLAVASVDHKRPAGVMFDAEHGLAFRQFDGPTILF